MRSNVLSARLALMGPTLQRVQCMAGLKDHSFQRVQCIAGDNGSFTPDALDQMSIMCPYVVKQAKQQEQTATAMAVGW